MASTVKLKVYSQNKNTNTNGSSISTYLYVANEGNVPVSYGDVSVRYWFTAEGAQPLNYWVDYAKLGNVNISGQFVRNAGRQLADTYFEMKVKSTIGMLYPSANTGNIQYRLAKSDWTNFNETNDYSYKASAPFDMNEHISVYYKGQLVFGTEPVALGSSRLAAEEKMTQLQVSVLGNPVTGDNADVDIRGAAGATLWMTLTTINGATVLEKKIDKAAEVEHHVLPLGKSTGVYLLRVNTLNESSTLKILKP